MLQFDFAVNSDCVFGWMVEQRTGMWNRDLDGSSHLRCYNENFVWTRWFVMHGRLSVVHTDGCIMTPVCDIRRILEGSWDLIVKITQKIFPKHNWIKVINYAETFSSRSVNTWLAWCKTTLVGKLRTAVVVGSCVFFDRPSISGADLASCW